MICVRIRPEAPTIPPIATRRTSFIARPAIAPATPEKELRSEIVIGISAPPTLIENSNPKANDSTNAAIANGRSAGTKTGTMQIASEPMSETAVNTLWPGRTTGFDFMIP